MTLDILYFDILCTVGAEGNKVDKVAEGAEKNQGVDEN